MRKTFDGLLGSITNIFSEQRPGPRFSQFLYSKKDPRVIMFVVVSEMYRKYLTYTDGEIFAKIRNSMHSGGSIEIGRMKGSWFNSVESELQILYAFYETHTSFGGNETRKEAMERLIEIISARSGIQSQKIKEETFPHIMLAIATMPEVE